MINEHNVKEIAEIVELAKEATEKAWGPIKRPPDNNPSEDYDEAWRAEPINHEEEGRLVIDTVAWDTYQMVLNRLLTVSLDAGDKRIPKKTTKVKEK